MSLKEDDLVEGAVVHHNTYTLRDVSYYYLINKIDERKTVTATPVALDMNGSCVYVGRTDEGIYQRFIENTNLVTDPKIIQLVKFYLL